MLLLQVNLPQDSDLNVLRDPMMELSCPPLPLLMKEELINSCVYEGMNDISSNVTGSQPENDKNEEDISGFFDSIFNADYDGSCDVSGQRNLDYGSEMRKNGPVGEDDLLVNERLKEATARQVILWSESLSFP